METFKNWVIGILAIALVVLGTLMVVNKPLGGSSTSHYFAESFLAPVTLGGPVFATSSVGTVTYTIASLRDFNTISHTTASAVTATLPASTTMQSFLPNAGDTRTIYLNAITGTVTVAGGTGTLLVKATTSAAILPGGTARLDFVKKVNGDVNVLMTSGI